MCCGSWAVRWAAGPSLQGLGVCQTHPYTSLEMRGPQVGRQELLGCAVVSHQQLGDFGC